MSDDLERLISDLHAEAVLTDRDVRGVLSKGALNIKQDWRKRAQGIKHAPRYPLSIGYDLKALSAVIGPEASADNQGFLGDVLEFGGAHNAPRNDGGQALDAELPRSVKAFGDLLGRHLT